MYELPEDLVELELEAIHPMDLDEEWLEAGRRGGSAFGEEEDGFGAAA
jgi:hypothetical protein